MGSCSWLITHGRRASSRHLPRLQATAYYSCTTPPSPASSSTHWACCCLLPPGSACGRCPRTLNTWTPPLRIWIGTDFDRCMTRHVSLPAYRHHRSRPPHSFGGAAASTRHTHAHPLHAPPAHTCSPRKTPPRPPQVAPIQPSRTYPSTAIRSRHHPPGRLLRALVSTARLVLGHDLSLAGEVGLISLQSGDGPRGSSLVTTCRSRERRGS